MPSLPPLFPSSRYPVLLPVFLVMYMCFLSSPFFSSLSLSRSLSLTLIYSLPSLLYLSLLLPLSCCLHFFPEHPNMDIIATLCPFPLLIQSINHPGKDNQTTQTYKTTPTLTRPHSLCKHTPKKNALLPCPAFASHASRARKTKDIIIR